MSHFVALVSYTDKGIAHIKDSPSRLDKARDLLREMGGDFKQVFLTMGGYDMVVVYEAPDDATAARFSLRLGMSGFVRTTTLKAFPEAAYREIIGRIDE
ncbi:GYD domain-containing protein [Geminicoccus roseus]|uniref:GYD domain-containing protein n=1 Tax=Geminicoccus roseus TaxID=404900 RepID=UPI000422F29F|nr:GYD domain-containing protein [Geminicoccus roseus]